MEKSIHQSAFVDEGAEIGQGTKIWHYCHVCSGAKIGENCVLGHSVYIAPGVVIGDGCKIQNHVSIYTGVTLEESIFIGPSVCFTNVINPRAFIDRKTEFLPTYVEGGVTICANATIICGNRIGRFSFIAAGAVVTKDVPPYAVMIGVPARIAKTTGCKALNLSPVISKTGSVTCIQVI